MTPQRSCSIIPPYMLEALAGHADQEIATRARRTLEGYQQLQRRRSGAPDAVTLAGRAPSPAANAGAATGPQRTVSDAKGSETLPGTKVRGEGDPATADPAVNEAYDGLGDTWQLYSTAYGRNSLDGKGLPLLASVHYGKDYDNAFWDGTQMVFGDGDGKIFNRFTISVDVIGHELTHGVTEFTAGLRYQGQSGALNESISDVFGSLVKQQHLGQSAEQADWLIGEGLLTKQVHGVALRSMKAPGTAYDDPALGGKDPQPDSMSGYVDTTNDNGGVHLNSGIPNRAFYLAATGIGGNAWEGAGQVWYDVLTGNSIKADCDFATFVDLTTTAAAARFGAGSTQVVAVQQAWTTVGLGPASQGGGAGSGTSATSSGGIHSGGPGPGVPASDAELHVQRSGGFAGQVRQRTVSLEVLPASEARSWMDLLADQRLESLPTGQPHPDGYIYQVACASAGVDVTLPEQHLPGDVRDLIERTLEL